jgi:hypothetical protein
MDKLDDAVVDLRLHYDVVNIGSGIYQVFERGTNALVATIRPVMAAKVQWARAGNEVVTAALQNNGLWVV